MLLAIVSAVTLTACATSPVPTDQAKPTQTILDESVTTPKTGAGTLIIKRDAGMVGSACSIRVFVDGLPFAELAAGERVTAYLPPAEYIVGARSTGVCGGGDSEAAVTLKAKQTRVYRVSIDQGMAINIGPTAF